MTSSWGWPGFTAQVHFSFGLVSGWRAGDGRDSPLKYTKAPLEDEAYTAGDGRDSPLKYTGPGMGYPSQSLGMAGIHRSSTLPSTNGCIWILLGMAGIHRSSTLGNQLGHGLPPLGMAGIHRSSTLYLSPRVLELLLGMAGIHRSSTLDRAEPTEKQWVGAILLFKREESAQESLPVRAVFSHSRPPFCRIAGLSR